MYDCFVFIFWILFHVLWLIIVSQHTCRTLEITLWYRRRRLRNHWTFRCRKSLLLVLFPNISKRTNVLHSTANERLTYTTLGTTGNVHNQDQHFPCLSQVMRLGLKPFDKMNNKTQDCLLLVFMLLEYLFRFLYHAGLCMGADLCNVPGDTLRAWMCPCNFHNKLLRCTCHWN